MCFLLQSTGFHHALDEMALKLSGTFAGIYFPRVAFGRLIGPPRPCRTWKEGALKGEQSY